MANFDDEDLMEFLNSKNADTDINSPLPVNGSLEPLLTKMDTGPTESNFLIKYEKLDGVEMDNILYESIITQTEVHAGLIIVRINHPELGAAILIRHGDTGGLLIK